MKQLLLLAIVVLPVSLAHAQIPTDPDPRQAYFDALHARVLDFQKRHTITIRGSENPAALKRGEVLSMFFQRLAWPKTEVEFAQFAAERFGATRADATALRKAGEPQSPSIDACGPVLDGSLADGLSIARRFTEMADAEDWAAEAHYQAVINKLTPTTRAKVLQGIEEQAAGIVSVNLDYMAMAQEDPELLKTMVTALCRGKQTAIRSGPSPAPAVQENGVLSHSQR